MLKLNRNGVSSGGGGIGGTPFVALDFMSESDFSSYITYTRNDTVATHRNSSGKLVTSAANARRVHHTSLGQPLGTLSEPARTNYCTNNNFNPADTSGFAATGTATITRVFQPTPIAAAGLENVLTNGFLIQLAGGASGGEVTINGQIGATGLCAVSGFMAAVAGSGVTFGITSNKTAKTVVGSALTYQFAEDLTAGATTDQFTFVLPPSASIWITLNQLERGQRRTTPIKVAGATAARAADVLRDLSFNTRPYYNQSAGALVVEYINDYIDGPGTGSTVGRIISIGSQTGNAGGANFPDNQFAMLKNAVNGQCNSLVEANNVAQTLSPNRHQGRPGTKWPVGIAWDNTTRAVESFSGAGSYGEVTMTESAQLIDAMYIGSSHASSLQLGGCIQTVYIFYGAKPSLNEMVSKVWSGEDWAVITGGQSNMEGYFSSAVTFLNTGERALMDELDKYWKNTGRKIAINGSFAGTSFTAWQNNASPTSAISRWKKIATACMAAGIKIKAIWWDQGETDLGYSVTAFKDAWRGIFVDMQNHLGYTQEADYLPVIICPLGRYIFSNTATTDTNTSFLKQAQQELARDNAWIHLAPEKAHQPLRPTDVVHLDHTGYAGQAPLYVRKTMKVLGYNVSGGVDGPQITAITRNSATQYDITITHDPNHPGSPTPDFTPTTAIGGFRFFNNTTEVVPTSVVRFNATTIRVTFPTNMDQVNQKIRYCYDQLFSVVNTALVIDNQTPPLPLRGCEWNSSNTGTSWTKNVIL